MYTLSGLEGRVYVAIRLKVWGFGNYKVQREPGPLETYLVRVSRYDSLI